MTHDIDNDLDEGLEESTLDSAGGGRSIGQVEELAAENRNKNALPPQTAVAPEMLRHIIEGAILAAAQPLTIARIRELFDEELAPAKEEVQAALEDIQASYANHGIELKEVASGWRFQVRDSLAPWVNRLWEEKPQRYSRALLETLSLIAYRQPITRGDIEEIRGVAVSSHIMKTLMERDWVKVVGHRDVPGRPSLYATTRQFLDYFNLKSLDELPSLSEIRDLDELSPELNLEDEEGLGERDTDPVIADDNADNPVSNPPASNPEADTQDPEQALREDGFVDLEDAFEEFESIQQNADLAGHQETATDVISDAPENEEEDNGDSTP